MSNDTASALPPGGRSVPLCPGLTAYVYRSTHDQHMVVELETEDGGEVRHTDIACEPVLRVLVNDAVVTDLGLLVAFPRTDKPRDTIVTAYVDGSVGRPEPRIRARSLYDSKLYAVPKDITDRLQQHAHVARQHANALGWDGEIVMGALPTEGTFCHVLLAAPR